MKLIFKIILFPAENKEFNTESAESTCDDCGNNERRKINKNRKSTHNKGGTQNLYRVMEHRTDNADFNNEF